MSNIGCPISYLMNRRWSSVGPDSHEERRAILTWSKRLIHFGIVAIAILVPSSLVGQLSKAQSPLVPDGWYVYPANKLKNIDETTLQCFNNSHNEWRVSSEKGSLKIAQYVPQNYDDLPLPPMLKLEAGMPGRTIRAGLKSSIHFNNAWLLAYDAGEWGGGLWLSNEDGTKTKRIVSENVRTVVPFNGGVLVLSGLAHITMNFGNAFVLSNPDGMNISLEHAISLDGAPSAYSTESDGSILFTTTYGLCRITKTGELQRLFYWPNWTRQQYSNSISVIADGTVFIGMRMFVLKLSLSSGGYQEEWLLPNNCRTFSLREFDCVCRP